METTICVLSYNNLNITKTFLDLLFTYTDSFKLLLIDNGSADGTQSFLTSYVDNIKNNNQSITLILNHDNLGVIGGRNMGFELYKNDPTPLLCFLDNDQFVQKGWLEQHTDFMRNGNFDMVGVDAWIMDKKFMPIYNCKKTKEPFTYVGCGGMLIKKQVVDVIGSFDSQFNPAYFEDPDYNFRVLANNFSIGYNYSAKITHLPHQTLGKNVERGRIFRESYNKFCVKWAGHTSITMR